jgi:DNA-binding LytR/AlgR family response regulator
MNTEKIRVLIVEDKLLVAEDIAARLRKHQLHVVGICSSGEEAIQIFEKNVPDLVLMDIELDGPMDGIATASAIRKNHDVPIIYLSDFTDLPTLERAKKTLPENYLSKPFLEQDLIRAIDLAFYNFNNRPQIRKGPSADFLFLRTDNQTYVRIPVKEIMYLEAERAYCKVVCRDKTFIMSTSMNHIHEQINSEDFLKIHRSFIINVNNITAFEGNSVRIGDASITMNKEGKESLIARLKFIK